MPKSGQTISKRSARKGSVRNFHTRDHCSCQQYEQKNTSISNCFDDGIPGAIKARSSESALHEPAHPPHPPPPPPGGRGGPKEGGGGRSRVHGPSARQKWRRGFP